jgi:hypothetical protein
MIDPKEGQETEVNEEKTSETTQDEGGEQTATE